MSSKKAIVIGSGVAGLAASIRLARKGFETTVFEANAFPGGKINSIQLGEYRFDAGPSIFTGPEYLKELYDLCGADFTEFEMLQPETPFKYFFNDGTVLSLSHDRTELIEELSSKLDESPESLQKYLDKSAKNYEAIRPLFIEKSLHKPSALIGKAFFKAIARIPFYRLSSTMHEENSRAFRNPKTAQIFDRFATYNGSSPYLAPAMLNMIPHLEMNVVPPLPKKGMRQITDALYELAKKQGVQFHFNQKVDEILVSDGQVRGIKIGQIQHEADLVVSNMDVLYTYEQLLPNQIAPQKTLKQERSSSALVFYWGINKSFPQLQLHNIFFAEDYAKEFDALFSDKQPYADPTIYINITSKFIQGEAPQNGENWFVMINAPANTKLDWENEIPTIRKNVLDKIGKILGEDIENLIEEEEVMHPGTIEKRYFGKNGSIYGNASNNRYSAFYRHPNFSSKIKNLLFVGVSVHPGGGIPLALNSAKIAVESLR